MMVQMCAIFRNQGIKPQLLLLPPELLPPDLLPLSLLLELFTSFKDNMVNMGVQKLVFFNRRHLLVIKEDPTPPSS